MFVKLAELAILELGRFDAAIHPLTPQEANLLAALKGGRLVPDQYDHVGVAYPDSDTEVYTYKTGGSGGDTVATVTVTYTDDTKANASSVVRT